MKKVNFNALQNFEVPESWIENAINAKPKKKIYQLNFRYIGTAASVVLAVGITLFSLLYINRDVNPPVSPIVSTKSVASTPKQETTAATTSINEKNATRPSETTTGTVAATTSANSQARSTEASAAAQPTNASAQTTTRPKQTSNATRQTESTRPGQSKPTSPTQPVPQPITTAPEKETKPTEPVQESTASTEATEAMQKITTTWMRVAKISPNAFISDDDTDNDTFSDIPLCELFEKKITIQIPQELWDNYPNLGYIQCTLSNDSFGIDEGMVAFAFDNVTPSIIVFNLSDHNVNIPCGQYKMSFMFYSTKVQELTINSIATEYSVELKDDILVELQWLN